MVLVTGLLLSSMTKPTEVTLPQIMFSELFVLVSPMNQKYANNSKKIKGMFINLRVLQEVS